MERKYLGENDRIWCQSEEEAKKVIEIYYALGYSWSIGTSNYTYYRKDIVYNLFRAFIQYGTKDAAQQCNRNIISAKEFIKYYEKMIINGVELKAGMVIETETCVYVAFPVKNGIAFMNNTMGGWRDTPPTDIIRIRDLCEKYSNFVTSGKILWEKPQEVVLTMQEIADKFGINVEQLRIAKEEK